MPAALHVAAYLSSLLVREASMTSAPIRFPRPACLAHTLAPRPGVWLQDLLLHAAAEAARHRAGRR